VIRYVRYLLYGRLVTPKIKNDLLPPVSVHVGVDMGSAISGLLFCVALDPLLHAMHEVPRVLGTRAYMDDNQVWGLGVEWIRRVQLSYNDCTPSGLQVVCHTCCLLQPNIGPVDMTGVASWRIASQFALKSHPHARYFCAMGSTYRYERKLLVR
jgi:hypothetical protein